MGRFMDYEMMDSMTVISQLGELRLIINEILDERLKLYEIFQVAIIIEKLPPLWRDFRNYLKHKKNLISLKDLRVQL